MVMANVSPATISIEDRNARSVCLETGPPTRPLGPNSAFDVLRALPARTALNVCPAKQASTLSRKASPFACLAKLGMSAQLGHHSPESAVLVSSATQTVRAAACAGQAALHPQSQAGNARAASLDSSARTACLRPALRANSAAPMLPCVLFVPN